MDSVLGKFNFSHTKHRRWASRFVSVSITSNNDINDFSGTTNDEITMYVNFSPLNVFVVKKTAIERFTRFRRYMILI